MLFNYFNDLNLVILERFYFTVKYMVSIENCIDSSYSISAITSYNMTLCFLQHDIVDRKMNLNHLKYLFHNSNCIKKVGLSYACITLLSSSYDCTSRRSAVLQGIRCPIDVRFVLGKEGVKFNTKSIEGAAGVLLPHRFHII